MNYDEIPSDRSPEPEQSHHLHDDDEDGDWHARERLQNPVHCGEASKGKPRKRLIKESHHATRDVPAPELPDKDEGDGNVRGLVRDGSDGGKGDGSSPRLAKRGFGAPRYQDGKVKAIQDTISGDNSEDDQEGHRALDDDNFIHDTGVDPSEHVDEDGDVKENEEDTISGDDSEDDQEDQTTLDDDNFIDDTGVDPSELVDEDEEDGDVKENEEDTISGDDSENGQESRRTLDDDNFIDDIDIDPAEVYGSENEARSLHHHPETGKNERSHTEIALLVENVMAELEAAAEEDADLNRQGKQPVYKLKKLPLLTEALSKKQLQQEFLDHGGLTLLKNWLEPNTNIRASILKILNDFPIDLEQYDRREKLEKSGLGKLVMFLSKSEEETASNRKLAKELVDKWELDGDFGSCLESSKVDRYFYVEEHPGCRRRHRSSPIFHPEKDASAHAEEERGFVSS